MRKWVHDAEPYEILTVLKILRQQVLAGRLLGRRYDEAVPEGQGVCVLDLESPFEHTQRNRNGPPGSKFADFVARFERVQTGFQLARDGLIEFLEDLAADASYSKRPEQVYPRTWPGLDCPPVTPRKSILALVLALAATACGPSMVAYTPVNEKTKLSSDALFQAATAVLEQKGFFISDRDPGTYIIKTREKEVAVSSVPRLSYKYEYTVTTQNSTLSIATTCKQNSEMKRTEFEDCGDERPVKIVEETEQLKKEILTKAKSVE